MHMADELEPARRTRSVEWRDEDLLILDQTQLPLAGVLEKQDTIEQVWASIRQLKVRGAPAIGVAAAYGSVVGMRGDVEADGAEFPENLRKRAEYLASARPTAVNLSWALKRMVKKATESDGRNGQALFDMLRAEAIAVHHEDEQMCRRIRENGVHLIQPGYGVLTHCNAGRLATSEHGTATAPMYLAHQRGVDFRVYSDESRPLLQSARLTSWELHQAGVDVMVITDSAAAYMMSGRLIDLVLVGADRIAANGDVANKIGTLGVAIAAKHFGIPFCVAAPFSTIDIGTATGADITIEERDEQEVKHFGRVRTAPEGIKARNPAFDVTPHTLITGIITDRKVLNPPLGASLSNEFRAAS